MLSCWNKGKLIEDSTGMGGGGASQAERKTPSINCGEALSRPGRTRDDCVSIYCHRQTQNVVRHPIRGRQFGLLGRVGPACGRLDIDIRCALAHVLSDPRSE